ncbi:ATP-binding protein [Paucisalibacillus globulus]|uniref:ATP-binding protein n=1 Tax=Paucisalibacillus globulus TaxID=351095 RepID=UPI0003F8149D|nr:AAA family ATPase [Paucisalibacillus globulus]
MKLLRATIYGFGKWVDYDIDFSNQSFIAIYGENESGKTTIQRFLLFILFGMPPRQRKFYQPKNSSKMGGRLTIQDDEIGEYTIERLGDTRNGAAQCYTPDGEEYEESWLRSRLSGIDEKTYRSIFSFSALDLSKLQDVKEEDISEVLLGIGLTGSTRIHTAEKKLDQRLGDYFKPNGKIPIINEQLAKLNELQRELLELKQEESTYRVKKNAILELESEIELLTGRIKSEKGREYQLEKVIQSLPEVEEYINYQTRLKAFPDRISFPEDGMNRYEVLKGKLLPLKSDIKLRINNKNNFIEEKKELEAENNIFPLNEARTIYAQYTNYQENERELLRIQKQINEQDKTLNMEIMALNISLDKEVIEDIYLPFNLEKQWEDFKREFEEIKHDRLTNNENTQLQQSENNRIEKELEHIEVSVLSNEKRLELKKRIDTYKENKLLEALQQENSHKHKKWTRTREQTTKRIGLWLGASILIGIVFGVIGLLLEIPFMINISAVAIVLGITQWMLGKKSIKSMETMLKESSTPQTVELVTEDEIERAEHHLRIDQESTREIEFLENKLKDISIQLRTLHDQKLLLVEREADLQRRISEQRINYSFLESVDVVFWPELYRSLKVLLQLGKNIADLQIKEAELKAELTGYHNNIDTFLQDYGFENNAKSLVSKLDFLEFEINAYLGREKEISKTTKMLDDTSKQLKELLTKCEIVEKEIKALFDFANVQNEEEFYQRAKELKIQAELRVSSEKIFSKYSSYFSKEEWENLVMAPPKKSTLELEINEIKNEIRELEESQDRNRQKLANITVEFQSLESSETYSKMVHKFQLEKEKLTTLSRQWAVYKTARDLLAVTKVNYRNKYLSKVIAKTNYFFKQITGGNYTKVDPPIGDKPFTVERDDQFRFTVQELSQGTINQLYVSLRLAVSEVMSESMHLPFMIDDAFVHFDDTRRKRIMTILEEIAKRHQVLLFTCKQEVLEEIHDKSLHQLTNRLPLVENEW